MLRKKKQKSPIRRDRKGQGATKKKVKIQKMSQSWQKKDARDLEFQKKTENPQKGILE